MSNPRIEHITLLVTERQRTIDFFRSLGFEHRDVGRHKWVSVGNQFIHITEDSGTPVADTFYHFAIEVDDLDERATKYKSMSYELVDYTEAQNFFIRDPDGNLIEFKAPWKPTLK